MGCGGSERAGTRWLRLERPMAQCGENLSHSSSYFRVDSWGHVMTPGLSPTAGRGDDKRSGLALPSWFCAAGAIPRRWNDALCLVEQMVQKPPTKKHHSDTPKRGGSVPIGPIPHLGGTVCSSLSVKCRGGRDMQTAQSGPLGFESQLCHL